MSEALLTPNYPSKKFVEGPITHIDRLDWSVENLIFQGEVLMQYDSMVASRISNYLVEIVDGTCNNCCK